MSLWPNLSGGEVIDLLGRLRGDLNRRRRDDLLERFFFTAVGVKSLFPTEASIDQASAATQHSAGAIAFNGPAQGPRHTRASAH